jgi:hypothetical protein
VQLLFWGNQWTQQNVSPSIGSVISAIQKILAGSYMSALGQYGIGPGTLSGATIITWPNPPNPFFADDWHNLIWDLIDNDTFPKPDSPDARNFYSFVLPPEVNFNDPNAVGAHGSPGDYDFPSAYDRVWAGWVMNDGRLDTVTRRFSHELVEACTDPEDDGWTIDGRSPPLDEIADVCLKTLGKVNGIAVQGYWSQRDRACIIPTGTLPLGGVSGVPTLIQSRFGNKGNFELVTPMASGGLAHYWRNNDNPLAPWFGPIRFGQEAGRFEAVGMIQSNFGDPGNLEVVGRIADRLVFFWRGSGPAARWSAPIPIIADGVPIAGVTGNPVLIQSRRGDKGNFELVTPMASGGLAHYWRNNDDPAIPWHGPTIFGQELGIVGSISLIEKIFGNPGNLELVAGVGTNIEFLWRDSGPEFARKGPIPIAAKGISPVLVQSRFGAMGKFEILTIEPSSTPDGGIVHYWRNDDDSSPPWSEPTVFGRDPARQRPIESLTFIQSNFANPGNLEVIVRIGDQFVFFWRDSGPAFNWNGPIAVTAGS